MTEKLGKLLIVIGALALASCPNPNRSPCDEECGRRMQCDPALATCVPIPLDRFERPIPGRAARITSSAAHVWIASIDPADGGIVVTQLDEDGDRDPRLLAQPPRRSDRRLAIDSSGRMIAVAWLGSSGQYDVAYRSLPGSHDSWSFTTIAVTGEAYFGTDAFDLAVVENRGLALVFRDRDRTLQILRTTDPEEEWTLEMVDDGGAHAAGDDCPDEVRRDSGLGVGLDPSLAARASELAVAYHDADCGDLRLARRGDERWSVTVVDSGDVSIDGDATRARVGRWPSLVFDAAGEVSVAYHDLSQGRLLLATQDNGGFERVVIDGGFEIDAFSRERKTVVGAFASLTIDDDDRVTVAYFDATSADLMLANRDGSGGAWSHTTLVSEGAVGFFADHTIEAGLGRFTVAERLVPTGDGPSSELVIVESDR